MILNREFYKYTDETLDLHCILDMQGRFLEWNEAWQDILGYSDSEMRKIKFTEFLHIDDRGESQKVYNYLLETGRTNGFVNRYISSSGEKVYLEWKASVVEDQIFASARNITSSRHLVTDVQEMHALHADVTSNMCSAFLVISNGIVEHSNQKFKDSFGMPGHTVGDINDQMMSIISVESQANWKSCFELLSNPPRHSESVMKSTVKVTGHPTIEWMRIKVVSGVRSFHHGRILCYFIDDTENMNRIREVEQALEQVKLANDAKRRFIANISHDLRTPLNGVYGMLELALMTCDDSEQASMLTTALDSAKKLNRVIDDILTFSDRDIRLNELNKSDFHLQSLVEGVIDEIDDELVDDMNSPNIKLSISGLETAFVNGDPEIIREIIKRLIGSTIEYSARKTLNLNLRYKPSQSAFEILQMYVEISERDYDQSSRTCPFISRESEANGSGNLEEENLSVLMLKSLVEALAGDVWSEQPHRGGIRFGVDFSVNGIVHDTSTLDRRCGKKKIELGR